MGCCTSSLPQEAQQDAPLVRPAGGNATASSGAGAAAGAAPAAGGSNGVSVAAKASPIQVAAGSKSPPPDPQPSVPDMQQRPPGTKPNNAVKSDLKAQARYEILPGAPLGKGHFAVVKRCRDVVTGQLCAVKIIDKKEMVKSTASVVKQEIEILKAVGNHPNIVQLLDHWEDVSRHFLVMELCSGGDLFSQIVEHGKYSEQEAARCCRQLADALKHIHACGITHRDLKPENILLVRPSPDSPLKLADFGLSKLIKGHLHPMRTVCGTWAYCLAEDTMLRCVTGPLPSPSSTLLSSTSPSTSTTTKSFTTGLIRARDVTPSTVLLDEYCAPVSVKAIHTTPSKSVEQLWTVRDARTQQIMFRCTGDHKLSFIKKHATSSRQEDRRVEVRCFEYAKMTAQQQSNLLAYTASPDAFPSSADLSLLSPSSSRTHPSSSLPSHVSSAFPITVTAPLSGAPLEPFVGIEVSSETHRFVLATGVVTSNCAPEVIQRRPYDSSVDNWTLGVLMYILLSGYHPFDVYGECPEPELLHKIISCSYDFDDPVWEGISESAKELIRGLLVLDPAKRLSIDKFLESPWIAEGRGAGQQHNPLLVERLAKFSVGKTKFRALVVAKIASNKFKASISRSKNKGVSDPTKATPFPGNDPDFLGVGLASEKDRPLESVREAGLGGGTGALALGGGSSSGGSSSGAEGVPIVPASPQHPTATAGTTAGFEPSSSALATLSTAFDPTATGRGRGSTGGRNGNGYGNGNGGGGGGISTGGAGSAASGVGLGGVGGNAFNRTQEVDIDGDVEWTRDADGELGGGTAGSSATVSHAGSHMSPPRSEPRNRASSAAAGPNIHFGDELSSATGPITPNVRIEMAR